MGRYEKQLRDKAFEFINRLKEHGFRAGPAGEFDYQHKIKVFRGEQNLGFASVWYSPKKDSFSMTVNEMTEPAAAGEVKAAWESGARKDFHDSQDLSGYHLFVDGSCRDSAVRFAYIAVHDGMELCSGSGDVDLRKAGNLRNIAGEVQAVLAGLERLRKEGARSVTVHFDYNGLEKWATGEWKTNNPVTRSYKDYFRKLEIKVHWNKVKSHSGHYYNELADRLAAGKHREKG